MDSFRGRANTYPQGSSQTTFREKIPKSQTIDDYIKRDISEETPLDLVQEVLTLLNITKLFTVFSRQLVQKYDAKNPEARKAVVVRALNSLPDPADKTRKLIVKSPLGNCNECRRTIPFEVECANCVIKQLFYCNKDLCWIKHLKTQTDTYIQTFPLTEAQPWVVCIMCRTALLTNKFMDIHHLPRYRVMRGVFGKNIPLFDLIQEKSQVAKTGKYYLTCDLQESCTEEDFRLTKLVPCDCPNCMRSRRVFFLCKKCNVLYTCKELRPDYIVYSDYECPRHHYEEKYGKDLQGLDQSIEEMQLDDPPKGKNVAGSSGTRKRKPDDDPK